MPLSRSDSNLEPETAKPAAQLIRLLIILVAIAATVSYLAAHSGRPPATADADAPAAGPGLVAGAGMRVTGAGFRSVSGQERADQPPPGGCADPAPGENWSCEEGRWVRPAPDGPDVVRPAPPEARDPDVVEPAPPEPGDLDVVEPAPPGPGEPGLVEPAPPEADEPGVVEPAPPEPGEPDVVRPAPPQPGAPDGVEPSPPSPGGPGAVPPTPVEPPEPAPVPPAPIEPAGEDPADE